MSSCFYCKGDMVNDTTTYMLELNNHYFIIKNVPCHKCSQCGEVSYSGTVISRIEEIIDKLKNNLQEVSITEYAA